MLKRLAKVTCPRDSSRGKKPKCFFFSFFFMLKEKSQSCFSLLFSLSLSIINCFRVICVDREFKRVRENPVFVFCSLPLKHIASSTIFFPNSLDRFEVGFEKKKKMAEEYTECLLENKFHEDCPGCKVDQMKRLRRGFPFWELCTVWIIVLCTGKKNHSSNFDVFLSETKKK